MTKPEQQALSLYDVRRDDPSMDPDTLQGVIRTIAGGRRGTKRVQPDPLFRGATELREAPPKEEIGPATHTVAKGREVWCFDGEPGKPPFASFTTSTLPLTETGRRRLTGLRDGGTAEFRAPDAFETYRDGTTYDHLAGTVVATPHARKRKESTSHSMPPRA